MFDVCCVLCELGECGKPESESFANISEASDSSDNVSFLADRLIALDLTSFDFDWLYWILVISQPDNQRSCSIDGIFTL